MKNQTKTAPAKPPPSAEKSAQTPKPVPEPVPKSKKPAPPKETPPRPKSPKNKNSKPLPPISESGSESQASQASSNPAQKKPNASSKKSNKNSSVPPSKNKPSKKPSGKVPPRKPSGKAPPKKPTRKVPPKKSHTKPCPPYSKPCNQTFSTLNPDPRKRICRSAACRCWYCCRFHCLGCPVFWAYGVALFVYAYMIGYEIYKYPESVLFPTEYLSVAAGTMLYALLFVILTQLVFVLVLYESIHWCSKCLFGFLFAVTFLTCLIVLGRAAWNSEFGPMRGKLFPVKQVQVSRPFDPTVQQRLKRHHFFLMVMAAITLALLVLLLHMYLHNILQFTQEIDYENDPEGFCQPKNKCSPCCVDGADVIVARPMRQVDSEFCCEDDWNHNTPSFREILRQHNYV